MRKGGGEPPSRSAQRQVSAFVVAGSGLFFIFLVSPLQTFSLSKVYRHLCDLRHRRAFGETILSRPSRQYVSILSISALCFWQRAIIDSNVD